MMDNSLKLTQEDYENLRKLFFIVKKIKWAYDNLAILEANKQKDTEEFTNWVGYLNKLLELEKQIYYIIGNDAKKINNMLDYILGSDAYNITDVLTYINEDEEEEMLKNRVAAYFDYLLLTMPFPDDEEEENEEDEIEIEEESEEINVEADDLEREFFYQSSVDLMMEQDIIHTILEILKNCLTNPYYENIKNDLIKFKYKLSFSFAFVEKEFLENNFNINDTLFWQTKMYTDTEGKNGNKTLNKCKSTYVDDLLREQCDDLLEMFYNGLRNKDGYAKLIIIEILVRTGLIFASQKIIDNFIVSIKSGIDYLEENNIHNKKVKNIIYNSFSHIEEDKTLPNILSFRL